jgi:hypothetical protein
MKIRRPQKPLIFRRTGERHPPKRVILAAGAALLNLAFYVARNMEFLRIFVASNDSLLIESDGLVPVCSYLLVQGARKGRETHGSNT